MNGATVTLAGDSDDSDTCADGAYSFVASQSVDATYDFTVGQSKNGFDSETSAVQWIRSSAAPATPIVTSVSSPSSDGTYYPGDEILLHVTYDVDVVLAGTGTPSLLLETGTTDRSATYTGMSGTDTLVFSYTVQAGDTSADLNTHATAPQLSLNGRTLRGANTADASLTMAGTSLASNKALVVVSTIPLPTVTTPASSPLSNNASSITIAGACVTGFTVTLEGDASDSETCASSAYSFTVNETTDGTYDYTVKQSKNGNDSGTVPVQWIRDTVAPVVTDVSSPDANGTYYLGDEITIHVTFDKAVTLSGVGTPSLLLETGTTDRSATYTMTGTDTLVFSYTVQAGDTSADLSTHASAPDLSLNGSTLRDSFGNDAELTLDETLLASNKALVIDGSQVAPPSICDSGNYFGTCTVTSARLLTTTVTANNLVIANGGSLTTNAHNSSGNVDLTLSGNLTVQSGGTIHGNFTISAVNVDIDSGGVIKADAKGAAGALGWAGGAAGSSGGAGHGGAGNGNGDDGCGGGGASVGGQAAGACTAGSASSATASAPMSHGGGAGGGQSETAYGGNGGGHIKIIASGSIVVDGILSANGGVGVAVGSNHGGGGGGGSVWVASSSASISGSGVIEAKGGNGQSESGGGGGGFIALDVNNPFIGTLSVAGGSGANSGTAGSIHLSYGSGDASALCSAGNLSTTCTISNTVILPDAYTLSGSGSIVVISGGSLLAASNSAVVTLDLEGDLDVESGGGVTGNFLISADNITIDSGAQVSANLYGCLGGRSNWNEAGIGCGPANAGSGGGGNNGGGGAGHGGNGGGRSDNYGFGYAYGSSTAPVTRGSGGTAGGAATGHFGGDGGGRLKLVAAGTLTINGSVTANGGNGQSAGGGGGGGSGGSIWLDANILNVGASGVVRASGGNAGGSGAGGGGGGRIAYYYLTSVSNAGTISAAGGSGGANNGASGTIHAEQIIP